MCIAFARYGAEAERTLKSEVSYRYRGSSLAVVDGDGGTVLSDDRISQPRSAEIVGTSGNWVPRGRQILSF